MTFSKKAARAVLVGILALCLLALCACQQPAQEQPTPATQNAPAEQPATAAAYFQSQQELRNYLEDHAALSGNLPAFCEAVKDGVPEKLEAGAVVLEAGKDRLAAYLFERLDRFSEDAFADDAIWTLSDTPRGNLLLEGEEIRLVYNADEDAVHPPRKAEISEDTSATLYTRYEQASFAPDVDPDSPQVQALTGYLRENPEIFSDDGISVLEDAAWMLQQRENDTVLLLLLRENPFCGLFCCTLSATKDGQVKALPQQCLDAGWFLDEMEDGYLLKRFSIIGCDEQTAERMAQWMQQQAETSLADSNMENWPCFRSVLSDARKAVWLMEQTTDGTRLLFLSPYDRTYRERNDGAPTLTAQQLYDVDGEIRQGMPGALWTTCRDVIHVRPEATIGDFSVHQMLTDIPFDATYGFYLLENEPWVSEAFGVGWARLTDGRMELWVLEDSVFILRSWSEDYLLPSGLGVGSTAEALQTAYSEYWPRPISTEQATAVVGHFIWPETLSPGETVGGFDCHIGSIAIYYTVGSDGIITQMIIEGPV